AGALKTWQVFWWRNRTEDRKTASSSHKASERSFSRPGCPDSWSTVVVFPSAIGPLDRKVLLGRLLSRAPKDNHASFKSGSFCNHSHPDRAFDPWPAELVDPDDKLGWQRQESSGAG